MAAGESAAGGERNSQRQRRRAEGIGPANGASAGAAGGQEIRRGWCLGSEEFRREPLAAATDRAGSNHYGRDRFESSQEAAWRMIAQELKRLGWAESELARRRKGDRRSVELARRLRSQMRRSLAWVAEDLRMGSWSDASNLLGTTEKHPVALRRQRAMLMGHGLAATSSAGRGRRNRGGVYMDEMAGAQIPVGTRHALRVRRRGAPGSQRLDCIQRAQRPAGHYFGKIELTPRQSTTNVTCTTLSPRHRSLSPCIK